MFRTIFYLILFTAFGSRLCAQSYAPPCGMTREDLDEVSLRLRENLAALESNPLEFRDVRYVPLTFLLVANTDGTGRIADSDVYDQLCALNEDYTPVNIQFYIKKLKYINNSTVYQTHAQAFGFMQFQRELGSINIWVVNDATPFGDALGTTLGYYSPGTDWLVMRKDEVAQQTSSLSHEVGHYFSLDHPFNGWDQEPYDPNIHGVPAPATSPGGVPTEKQDGSNCATAGDYICDTPPDYNLGFGWPNCNYTGGAKDPMGVTIDPEEKLFMGYFLNCPRNSYFFSPLQQNAMNQDLTTRLALGAGNIRKLSLGNSNYTAITGAPALTSPIGGATTPNYNAVQLTWDGVAGADLYFLQVSRLPNLSTPTFESLVYGNSKVVTNLQAGKTYYWRIKPLSNYYACAPYTATATFNTGTAVGIKEVAAVNFWSVSPNPVKADYEVNININANAAFDGQFYLLTATGQEVKHFTKSFQAGENALTLPMTNLQAGVYFLTLQTEQGQTTQRIVVSQ